MLPGKEIGMMTGNPSSENADRAAELILSGRYAEAFVLLDKPGENSVAGLFNLALCHIYAGDHAAALVRLEAALSAIRRSGIPAPPPQSPPLRTITEIQNRSDSYRRPFTAEYVKVFPHIAHDSILRLIVDCHAALGNNNKVAETGAPLAAKGYANVMEALEKIK